MNWAELSKEARKAAEEGAMFEMTGAQAVQLLLEVTSARKAGQDEALIAFQAAVQEVGLDSLLLKVVIQNARRNLS